MTEPSTETVYEGRFLRIDRRGAWEYAARTNARGGVAVIALHDDGRIVLVEQHRPPVDAFVVEPPAGLSGDTDDSESLLESARRELEEETGYTARAWQRLETAYASPGMTDEAITFFLARGLTKTGKGGGVDAENITVHEVPLDDLPRWLAARGGPIDMKLYAGLFAASAAIEDESSHEHHHD
ncbi:MAG: hypothetical protein CMJ18_20590 [Phycisphaeraceae bacterium]|nr:hypothetical protein [Phycisphaeraceae bacterium]